MSEDAHEIAQRIVREVLDAHETEVARNAPTPAATEDGGAGTVDDIDLRDTGAALAADAAAAVLDDSVARQTARRIVAEVLASHAEAERDPVDELPVAAEGEAAGPASATPVLHPITGRPAVLPSLPDEPDLGEDADVADDAAAIARRIVASVLNQRPTADDGPPPLPDHARLPVDAAEPEPAAVDPASEDEAPVGDLEAPVADLEAPLFEDQEPEPGPATGETESETPAPEGDVVTSADDAPVDDGSDPDATAVVEPLRVHGSHRLVAHEPVAEPEPEPVAEVESEPEREPVAEAEPELEPVVEAEPGPDATALLTPDEPGDADATRTAPVATLERPATRDPAGEATVSLPSAEPPRRTGRWLLASILGAVALAVLLPLAVEALRTLVSLS